MKWKQNQHCLKGVGIYSIGETKRGTKLELSVSLDHRLYTPIIASMRDHEIPNKYCFVMKVSQSYPLAHLTNNHCFIWYATTASFVVEGERSKVLLCQGLYVHGKMGSWNQAYQGLSPITPGHLFLGLVASGSCLALHNTYDPIITIFYSMESN